MTGPSRLAQACHDLGDRQLELRSRLRLAAVAVLERLVLVVGGGATSGTRAAGASSSPSKRTVTLSKAMSLVFCSATVARCADMPGP